MKRNKLPAPKKDERTRFRRPSIRSLAATGLLLATMAMLFQACSEEPARTTTSDTLQSGTPAATSGTTAAATAATGTEATVPEAGTIDVASAERTDLPDVLEATGWTLVRILPDGRFILNSGSRLSIFNPVDGTEVIIREAEFGIQAAANDRYVAFGIGGDEVLEIFVHHIAGDYTERVLKDPDGYLDLEVTRSDGVLASRIRYTGAEAVLDAWVRYDVKAYTSTVIPSGERSYAKYLFREQYPDKNAVWTYGIGQIWHEAWVDGSEQLFYSEVVRNGRDDYELRIRRSAATGDDPVLYSQSKGPIPIIRLSGSLIVVDDATAIRTDTGHVLELPVSDLPDTEFPHGAAFVGTWRGRMLVAALDPFGRPADMYRFSLHR